MGKFLRDEGGQALTVVALMMVVLLGFAALTIDLGMVRLTGTKMQNAADAAALAAARDLPYSGKVLLTAEKYGGLNGAESTAATAPYDGDPDKVEVVCTKNVPYSFARVLGFTDADVSARAVAAVTAMGGPFDFALFGGSGLSLLAFSGHKFTVYGNVHSNYMVSSSAGQADVCGYIQAVKAVTIANVTVSEGYKEGVEPIPMPDFADIIKSEAAGANQVYTGDQTFTDGVNVDSSIYVKGDLTVSGGDFTGKGAILVSGDITFNGAAVDSLGGASVCFYSENGNIFINGPAIELSGLVYAPRGVVYVSAHTLHVKGRVIADHISFSGGNFSVEAGKDELEGLPKIGVQLVE